ncbi:hypothetical protein [uncultured Campylobacter sp.]|uniref:hypothetical protein n=1 Tax=uncultured Campylobacter sp. TaxID=218934 RepID=UPI0028EE2D1F|nr:hypothetical protein [uncultured Campylobacter sp.]
MQSSAQIKYIGTGGSLHRSLVKLNANDRRRRSAMDIFCFKDGKIIKRLDII